MASKRNLRRKACDGKKRYETRQEADKGLFFLVKNTGTPFANVYHCFAGDHWHIGHKPRTVGRGNFKDEYREMGGATS